LKPIDRAYQKARLLKIPFNVHFDLTYRCHLSCVHCYLPEEWRRGEGPGPELDTGQVKSVLDQLAAAGTFWLTFSGGEIFLRPDLIDLVKYARRLNFAVALKTSGTLGPNDAQIEALAEAGLDSLQVSFYSVAPALHDRVTGLPGSWARMWKTTEKCRARGLRVALMSTIFSFSFDQIRAIIDFTSEEDLYIRMNGILEPRWDGKPFSPGLEIGQERNEELHRLMGTEVRHWQEALTVPFASELSEVYEGCEAGQTICYLTPQGDLWPCMGLPYNCGKVIGGDNLIKVWRDSPKLNSIRAMQGQIPEAERLCDYFQRTRRGKIIEQFS
jgi:MoaA/NifB/PqqE/SkfB family radical SAM enzyme